MSIYEEIENAYFEWLCAIVMDKRYTKSKKLPYRKLLSTLHTREFYFIIPADESRAKDGINLRNEFAYENVCGLDVNTIKNYLNGPCSVLEMMVALALRIEEDIAGNCPQWFWLMIFNLGLNAQFDKVFERKNVENIITIFLNREYEIDGTGGLFIVKRRKEDLRKVEIWYQMQWYLGEITIEVR